jgi:hypothetical protein
MTSYYQTTLDRYFYERDNESSPFARAVLIDMETKVIENSLSEAKRS